MRFLRAALAVAAVTVALGAPVPAAADTLLDDPLATATSLVERLPHDPVGTATDAADAATDTAGDVVDAADDVVDTAGDLLDGATADPSAATDGAGNGGTAGDAEPAGSTGPAPSAEPAGGDAPAATKAPKPAAPATAATPTHPALTPPTPRPFARALASAVSDFAAPLVLAALIAAVLLAPAGRRDERAVPPVDDPLDELVPFT